MINDQYTTEDATQELLRISKWPEPLRLAYLLEKEMLWPLHGKAADCLRKMHAELDAIKRDRALDKKAENARELGLNYEPDYKVTVVDNQHPNGVPLEQWGRVAEQGEERMKKLIKDLISAMEYHVEQTRPIHSTTVALQAAREAIRAQPAPVQEPLFWYKPYSGGMYYGPIHNAQIGDILRGIEEWIPLYTTPPASQRTWVGLTDEEIEQEFGFIDELLRDCVHRTEAKIKEKNNG